MADRRPAWLPDGHDIETSFNLEIRIISTSTAKASDPSVRGSGTGSNQLDPLAITYPSGSSEQQQQQHKKRAIAKRLTPNKDSPAMSTRSKAPSPSSPAMGTRSKKKLDL